MAPCPCGSYGNFGCCMCSFCWSSVNRKNTESNLYGIIESACHNNAISTANFTDEFFKIEYPTVEFTKKLVGLVQEFDVKYHNVLIVD